MILITGASGHLGNVLVRELLASDRAPVRVLIEAGDEAPGLREFGTQIERITGDITDSQVVEAAMVGVQEVVHLAGLICIHADRLLELKTNQVNVQGTQNVIEACLKFSVKQLIYISSVHALSEPPKGGWINEACGFDPNRAHGVYGKSKAIAALKVLEAQKLRGLPVTLLCPTGIIGPFDFRNSEMGFIFSKIARRGMALGVEGEYNFVDVRDVVSQIVNVLNGKHQGQVFLITGHTVTIRGLMDQASQCAGKVMPKLYLPLKIARFFAFFEIFYAPLVMIFLGRRPRLTRYSMHTLGLQHRFDGSKAKEHLGYVPRPLHTTLQDTIEWHRKKNL